MRLDHQQSGGRNRHSLTEHFLTTLILSAPVHTKSKLVEASRLLGDAQLIGSRAVLTDRQRILINDLMNFNLSLPLQKRDQAEQTATLTKLSYKLLLLPQLP